MAPHLLSANFRFADLVESVCALDPTRMVEACRALRAAVDC
jgi:hypothetical protein